MNDIRLPSDLFETVADEFLARLRDGQSPTIDEYVERYPDIADDILDLFPTMMAVEQVKIAKEYKSGGQASLGARKLEQLGDFRIIREIGRGGMGVVYEAEQESLERRVAVKVLPPHALLDPTQVRRFHREAQTAAGLHHTNIVPVFGVGQAGGLHYYVMQLIDGQGVDKRLQCPADKQIAPTKTILDKDNSACSSAVLDHDPTQANKEDRNAPTDSSERKTSRQNQSGTAFSPHETARIGASIADALVCAHEQGILHRDIKPANVLIDSQNHVWITDFGLAQVLESDETRSDHLGGTLRYMAPERFEGQSDPRSDLYSLGITLYEMATGTKAFSASNSSQLIQRITQTDPPAPRSLNSSIPRDLETIIQKSIAREPQNRYQTAQELAEDLHRFLKGQPIRARRLHPLERLGRWCQRNPALAASLSLVALLLVTVGVITTSGYVRTANLNEHLNESLNNERAARQTAEATTALALEALDNVFDGFSPMTPHTVALSSSDELDDSSETEEELILPAPPAISPQIARTLERLLPLFSRLAAQTGQDPLVRERAASAYQRIGLIYRQLSDYDAARDALEEAIPLLEGLYDTPQNRNHDHTLKLAQLYNDLGDIERLSRHRSQAHQAYQKALALLTVQEPPAHPGQTIELARTHYALGQRDGLFLMRRRSFPKKENSSAIKTKGTPPPGVPSRQPSGNSSDSPPPQRVSTLSPSSVEQKQKPHRSDVTRQRLAEFRARRRKQCEHLSTAISLLESLPEHMMEGRAQLLLARCYMESASQRRREERDLARNDSQRALNLLEELAASAPQVPEYQFQLAMVLGAVDAQCLNREEIPKVIPRMQRAHQMTQDLVRMHPAIPVYANAYLSMSDKLARFYRYTEQHDQAIETLQTALGDIERLTGRFSEQWMIVVWTSRLSRSLADLYLAQDRQADAIPWFAKSAELRANAARQLMAKEDPFARVMSYVTADTYRKLAALQEQVGETMAAQDSLEKAEEFASYAKQFDRAAPTRKQERTSREQPSRKLHSEPSKSS